jgi:hypothetical protein
VPDKNKKQAEFCLAGHILKRTKKTIFAVARIILYSH